MRRPEWIETDSQISREMIQTDGPGGRPTGISTALSLDLRIRVLAA